MPTMDAAAREQYVFRYLTLIDMARARSSFDLLRSATNKDLQGALFRDAVVGYAKACSSNRNRAGKKVLRMEESFVLPSLQPAHRGVLDLRNKIIAHVDLDNQAPNVTVEEIDGRRSVSFTVIGYAQLLTTQLDEPLYSLVNNVLAFCPEKLEALESAT